MPIIDQEIFNKNLLLTQAYCEMQLANTDKSPAEILRSFNPEYDDKPIFSFRGGQYSPPLYLTAKWLIDPLDSGNGYLYTDLFEKQLSYKAAFNLVTIEGLDGRILVTEIDRVIWDGASELDSNGFIDINDCTPIDTWFYIEDYKGDRLLYSWIPVVFVKSVGDAMEVNMLNTFNWVEDFTYSEYSLKAPSLKEPAYSPSFNFAKEPIIRPLRLDALVYILILISIILWFIFRQ